MAHIDHDEIGILRRDPARCWPSMVTHSGKGRRLRHKPSLSRSLASSTDRAFSHRFRAKPISHRTSLASSATPRGLDSLVFQVLVPFRSCPLSAGQVGSGRPRLSNERLCTRLERTHIFWLATPITESCNFGLHIVISSCKIKNTGAFMIQVIALTVASFFWCSWPAVAAANFEIIYSSLSVEGTPGNTNSAYVIDRTANKAYLCLTNYVSPGPGKGPPTLTASCSAIPGYASHISSSANIQSKASNPPGTANGYGSAGVWQIDQDAGTLEFCYLAIAPGLANGNCITIPLN